MMWTTPLVTLPPVGRVDAQHRGGGDPRATPTRFGNGLRPCLTDLPTRGRLKRAKLHRRCYDIGSCR